MSTSTFVLECGRIPSPSRCLGTKSCTLCYHHHDSLWKRYCICCVGGLGECDKRARAISRSEEKKIVPPTRKDFPNLITDVLKVADAMLDGEIQYRQRGFDGAIESLRRAIHKVR